MISGNSAGVPRIHNRLLKGLSTQSGWVTSQNSRAGEVGRYFIGLLETLVELVFCD
jgi:hypothetical protein